MRTWVYVQTVSAAAAVTRVTYEVAGVGGREGRNGAASGVSASPRPGLPTIAADISDHLPGALGTPLGVSKRGSRPLAWSDWVTTRLRRFEQAF